jgi:methionine-gamma-lyase
VEDFPGHEIAKRQMRDYGGMMSIELNANRDTTAKVINSLKLCTIAVSLGDAETLVEHPASMTHSTYSAEELAQSGIAEGLVRISVGLEDVNDIIADFDQAFAQIK